MLVKGATRRHQMESFSALVALCEGNWPFTSKFPSQTPVALMFSLICAWANGWANHHDAGDLGRHRARYEVTVMIYSILDPRGFVCVLHSKLESYFSY